MQITMVFPGNGSEAIARITLDPGEVTAILGGQVLEVVGLVGGSEEDTLPVKVQAATAEGYEIKAAEEAAARESENA